MAVSTQQILNGIINMQADAQQALPVIPNNGNPAGAYNMPQTTMPQQAPVAPIAPRPSVPMTPQDRYPWLQPSQSASNVRAMLQARRGQVAPNTGIIPAQQQQQQVGQLPVLPLRR